jgi:hypothetical protein
LIFSSLFRFEIQSTFYDFVKVHSTRPVVLRGRVVWESPIMARSPYLSTTRVRLVSSASSTRVVWGVKSLYPAILRGEQLPLKKGDNFFSHLWLKSPQTPLWERGAYLPKSPSSSKRGSKGVILKKRGAYRTWRGRVVWGVKSLYPAILRGEQLPS